MTVERVPFNSILSTGDLSSGGVWSGGQMKIQKPSLVAGIIVIVVLLVQQSAAINPIGRL